MRLVYLCVGVNLLEVAYVSRFVHQAAVSYLDVGIGVAISIVVCILVSTLCAPHYLALQWIYTLILHLDAIAA